MSIALLKDRQIKLFKTVGHDMSAYRCAPWFDCSHLEWLIISLESQMRVDFCIEKCFKSGILVIHISPVVCPDPYPSRTQHIFWKQSQSKPLYHTHSCSLFQGASNGMYVLIPSVCHAKTRSDKISWKRLMSPPLNHIDFWFTLIVPFGNITYFSWIEKKSKHYFAM